MARLPVTLVLIQMSFTVLVICITSARTLHFGSSRDVLRWACTIPWLFTGMLATSMIALDYATMGALVVVRNLAPILTIAIESSFTGEAIEFDRPSVLSLLLIIGGVVLYVQHDVAFSPVGVGFMVANMCFGIFERMLQRRMIAVEPIDVSKTGMMLLNNGVRDMRRDRGRDCGRDRGRS